MAELRMSVVMAAQIVHEALRALAAQSVDVEAPLAWEQAPEWVRSAMIAEVVEVLEDPDGKSRWLNWSRVQRTHGWRHGPRLDGTRKTDPRLTSAYEDQQPFYLIRDRLIEHVIEALHPWLR